MKNLFDSTRIKSMKLKNRFFRASTWEGLATPNGDLTNDLFHIYEELAAGGVGTILTSYAHVEKEEQPNPGMFGIYDDHFILEYRRLVDAVHHYGANIVMQIAYGGSMTDMNPPSHTIWGPSAVKNERSGIVPIAMSRDDISRLTQAHAQAAGRVKRAGFDGVEIHAAHGYLLSQFLSPRYNRRQDEYGGSIENRARLLMEINEAVRQTVGDDFPILIKLNSSDFTEDGLTSEDSITAAKLLAGAGVDAIEISGGDYASSSVHVQNLQPSRTGITQSKDRESYFQEHAARLAGEVHIPVILTGGNRHIDVMEELLNSTGIEYFALSRPLTCEPDLIQRWEVDETLASKCISCNKCFSTYGNRCIFNRME